MKSSVFFFQFIIWCSQKKNQLVTLIEPTITFELELNLQFYFEVLVKYNRNLSDQELNVYPTAGFWFFFRFLIDHSHFWASKVKCKKKHLKKMIFSKKEQWFN